MEFKTGMMVMLGIVTCCYTGTGIVQFVRENYSSGGMWLAYAVANSCLMRMTWIGE